MRGLARAGAAAKEDAEDTTEVLSCARNPFLSLNGFLFSSYAKLKVRMLFKNSLGKSMRCVHEQILST